MSTLSSSMYTLARNPHILAKLRAEVLSVVGNGEVPDYEQARGMKYLRAFLNEVLRLFPPGKFSPTEEIQVLMSNPPQFPSICVPRSART